MDIKSDTEEENKFKWCRFVIISIIVIINMQLFHKIQSIVLKDEDPSGHLCAPYFQGSLWVDPFNLF